MYRVYQKEEECCLEHYIIQSLAPRAFLAILYQNGKLVNESQLDYTDFIREVFAQYELVALFDDVENCQNFIRAQVYFRQE